MFGPRDASIIGRERGTDRSPHLLEQIDELLADAGRGAARSLARLERTLTDGYALALALEAERWRLEQRIAELAGELGDGDRS